MLPGATRDFAHRLSLNLVELGFGLLGALIVILAGVVWRRNATSGARDEKL